MKRLLIAFTLLVAIPALADRVITTNLVSVTQDELVEVIVINDGAGGLDAVITYRVLDDAGNVYKELAVVRFPLDTDDAAKLNAFILTTVLPAVNEAEEL